ncbi:hypothetical protein GDO86_014644 [Hymenochirus boettgeri]|uniref:Phosphoribulokinase/uridine kinase domain-containing protein n=1 Tax=Hymenochirus boettgeri TaxID=247094 RepID=A0A8T2JUT3_9PIPI|nr:hypothetical protein GDO86_014644 [Hymenochirus boettgeri]KAG8447255.1 hypothetical protein GDO86_014644 [Hymenochirus boettgeri]
MSIGHNPRKPVIGLGGGSASGKTTVARMIIEALDVPWSVLLSMDTFYKVLTEEQQVQAAQNDFNFKHIKEVKTMEKCQNSNPRLYYTQSHEGVAPGHEDFCGRGLIAVLVRRLCRDISETERDIEGVLKLYHGFVKPAFDQYIQPTMHVADIVVP